MAELNLLKNEKANDLSMSLSTDSTLTHDVSEEFSLPDYVPEIRRLLCVKAQPLPESKYVSDKGEGTEIEFGGTMTYLLIYTDDEGSLCSLPLTSNYEAQTILLSRPETIFIDTVVDSVSPRVNAPRKITVKSRLKSRILGWENKEYKENIQGGGVAEEIFLQRKTENIKSISLLPISQQNIRVSDKLDMQGHENARPLWCDAFVYVKDTRAQNNTVSVRGEIKVKCLCQAGDEYVSLTKSIPLTEELEASGASLGDMARVGARCVSLSISNEENDENGQLFFDLSCELEGELIRNQELEITKDCYSTKYETEEQYKAVDIFSLIKAGNDSFSINEGVKRKDDSMSEIIDTMCTCALEKTEFKNGKCVLIGKLNITVIGLSSLENGMEVICESYELPFKYGTDVGKSGKDFLCRFDMQTSDASARIDKDKIYFNLELYPSYEIMERDRVEILDSSTIKRDKEIKKDLSCVRVCFLDGSSTLWDIAKKYHTTVASLEKNNDLTEKGLEGVKSLII